MGNFTKGLGEGLGQGLGIIIVILLFLLIIGFLVYYAAKTGFLRNILIDTIKKSLGL